MAVILLVPDVLLPEEEMGGLGLRSEAMSRSLIRAHSRRRGILHMAHCCGCDNAPRDGQSTLYSFRAFGFRKDFLLVRPSEVHSA